MPLHITAPPHPCLKKQHYFFMILALWLSYMNTALAEAHLTFHMGVGANNQFVIGGTLENRGDTPIERGYIAVLLVNIQCEPLHFLWQEFGPVPPHSTQQFSIPVTNPDFNAYRLVGFTAFDDMGFALPAIDDTKPLMAARQADEINACTLRRKTESPPS